MPPSGPIDLAVNIMHTHLYDVEHGLLRIFASTSLVLQLRVAFVCLGPYDLIHSCYGGLSDPWHGVHKPVIPVARAEKAF